MGTNAVNRAGKSSGSRTTWADPSRKGRLWRYTARLRIAYRPQMALDLFVVCARDSGDTLAKQEFYPDVPKSELFQRKTQVLRTFNEL